MDDLLNFAPCGFFSFSDDRIVSEVNHTLCSWLGYEAAEIKGKHVDTIFTTSTKIFYNTHFFPLIKLHSSAEEVFLSLYTKEKEHVPVLINAKRHANDKLPVTHCVVIRVNQRQLYEQEILQAKRAAENAIADNTHFKELTASLEQRTLELDRQYQRQLVVNQNLREFNKIISHDMQEPLRKIGVFADMVMRDMQERTDEKNLLKLQRIIAAVERLRSLTKGLHEYVSDGSETKPEVISLAAAIDVAHARAMQHQQFYDFDLRYSDLPDLEGYRIQLQLMFYHFIENAIKFRDPSRRLNIEVSAISFDENIYKNSADKYRFVEHVRISIKDNGIGFDNTYGKYVFELLKKVEISSDGLGIGLPLIKKIVANHRGAIDVHSIPGKGTTFTVILPLRMD
jgi:phosphoserine phosphatase RsbU/P